MSLSEKEILQYKEIRKVYCPYFNQEINFNSKGLTHIKFNGQGKARTGADQKFRIKHIKYAKIILEKSHTLQGMLMQNKQERIRALGVTEYKEKKISFYEFIAVVEDKRLKVIVKQIENGDKYFWSIIPFWKKILEGRKLHSINIEEI